MIFWGKPLATALVLLGAFTACAPAPAELSEQDVTDIKAIIDRWVDDFLHDKRDDLANLITEDAVIQPPNSAPLVGRDAAMAYMKAYPPITKFTVNEAEVVGHGDLAYVRGTYSVEVTLPAGPMQEEGTFLEIHRKQKDGSWPYSRLTWHSSQPPPPPPPPPALP